MPTRERLESIADVLRDMVLETPPNVTAGSWIAGAARAAAQRASSASASPSSTCACAASCSTCSSSPPATTWTAGSRARRSRRPTASTASSATIASPYAPGSAYVLLHHVFGEVNGKKGVWGHAVGGMGAITQAMAKAAAARGRRHPRRDAGVREVLVERGRAVGVVTEEGEAMRARAVVSNLNPKLLYGSLIDPAASAGGLPRAHRALALRLGHLPHERGARPSCRTSPACRARRSAEHHTAGIIMAPSLAYMEQAYLDAQARAAGRNSRSSRC